MFGLFKKKQETNEDGRRPDWADYAAVDILNGRSNNWTIDRMDPTHAPRTVDDGYAVQKIVVDRFQRPVAGWKIGCSSRLAQEMFGIPDPFFGPVFDDVFLKSPTWLPPDSFIRPGIEGEIAFTLKRHLKPRSTPYMRADIESAIDKVFAVIEVIDSCFRDFANAGAPNLIADLAANGGLAAFEGVDYEPGMDLKSVELTLAVNQAVVGQGVGADALGDPVDALVWLANESSRRGIGLKAGEIVSTGTCTGLVWLEPGQQVALQVSGIGSALLLYGDDDDFEISEDGKTVPREESAESRSTDEPAADIRGEDGYADEEEDEYTEPEPPSTERIVKRALCMAAVAIRSDAERAGEADQYKAQYLPWLKREGLEDELEPWERQVIHAPAGGLSDREMWEASWLAACCHVLSWALGLNDLPRPDKQIDSVEMLSALGIEPREISRTSVADLLAKSRRRSIAEVSDASELYMAINWRFRHFQLHSGPYDFVEASKKSWWHPFDPSGEWIVDGDLAFEGTPIHALDPDDLGMAHNFAQFRHRAVNWVEGSEPVFSEVPTDT